MRQKSYERVSAKRVRFPTQKTDKSSECVNKYHARHSESLYSPAKRLEKALEFTGAMDHDKTSCLCIFGEKKSIYQRGQAVLFFKLLTNTYTFYRCNKLEQHCARRQAERSYARCKYQHM